MIPKELQDRIDKFTEELKAHHEKRLEELKKLFTEFNLIVYRLDKDFQEFEVTTLEKAEWLKVRKMIEDMDDTINRMSFEAGSRCVQCQQWIEDKLKGSK